MALPSKTLMAADLEFGKLRRVSPEECEAALLLAIADRIKAGATSAELAHWRKIMLTVEIQYEYLATADDLYFRAVNIRRAVIVQNEALVRSAMQQIQEIMEYQVRKETSLGKPLDVPLSTSCGMTAPSKSPMLTLMKSALGGSKRA